MFLWVLSLLLEDVLEAAAAAVFGALMPLGALDAEPDDRPEDDPC